MLLDGACSGSTDEADRSEILAALVPTTPDFTPLGQTTLDHPLSHCHGTSIRAGRYTAIGCN